MAGTSRDLGRTSPRDEENLMQENIGPIFRTYFFASQQLKELLCLCLNGLGIHENNLALTQPQLNFFFLIFQVISAAGVLLELKQQRYPP